MAISASDIKKLRESTGAGMMDCKHALNESNGDYDAAVDWLRTKGLAKAAKKAGRTAAEGLIGVTVDGNRGAMIELNSETDFVSRNDNFQQLAAKISTKALETNGDIDALKTSQLDGKSVQDTVTEAVAKIGENMSLRRTTYIEIDEGAVVPYIHNSVADGLGKIGVLVALKSSGDKTALQQIGKQVAMHIAAAKPEAMRREDVDSSKLDRERDVLKEQAIESGKSPEIAEKMVEGRIRKYYEEVVLPEQTFVIDGKISVNEFLKNSESEVGAPISIADYALFVLGDGIEKEEDDFAAEVAKTANG